MSLINIVIEFFAELFIDIKLFRADSKHEKKISKKEKEDGKPRSFQKQLLKPSIVLPLLIIILLISIGVIFITYQRQVVYPKDTEKEMSKISNRVKQWHTKYGNLPITLKEVIGNSPVKQDWYVDSWHTHYRYTIINDNTSFLITSAGSDRQFNTDDDITSK